MSWFVARAISIAYSSQSCWYPVHCTLVESLIFAAVLSVIDIRGGPALHVEVRRVGAQDVEVGKGIRTTSASLFSRRVALRILPVSLSRIAFPGMSEK